MPKHTDVVHAKGSRKGSKGKRGKGSRKTKGKR